MVTRVTLTRRGLLGPAGLVGLMKKPDLLEKSGVIARLRPQEIRPESWRPRRREGAPTHHMLRRWRPSPSRAWRARCLTRCGCNRCECRAGAGLTGRWDCRDEEREQPEEDRQTDGRAEEQLVNATAGLEDRA